MIYPRNKISMLISYCPVTQRFVALQIFSTLCPLPLTSPKFEHLDWYSCAVFENGTLFGVASIDVPVSSTDLDIIKKKYVDPNVLPMRLACQMQQARSFSCNST